MRIAYLVHWDVSHETGVLKKITSQIRAWQHSDHTVKLFAVSFGNGIWAGLEAWFIYALTFTTQDWINYAEMCQ